MRRVATVIALTLGMSLVTGCTSSKDVKTQPSSPTFIKTSSWQAGDDQSQAGLEGRLEATADGCVVVKVNALTAQPIWPAGWTARKGRDGFQVLREDGSVAAKSGDVVRMSGAVARDDGCGTGGTFTVTDDLK